ncbi:MAG: FAD-dependent oxidoreductase [Syntrophales bacterium]
MSSGDDVKKGISRRDLLKGGTAAIAGLAVTAALPAALPGIAEAGDIPEAYAKPKCTGWSWEKPVKPIPKSEISKVITTDVVVIGAGLSGVAAALSAAEQGAKVQVVDKNHTWAARGGHITAFGSKVQQRMEVQNDYRQIIRAWVAWAQGRLDEKLLWDFAHKSGACMDWAVDIAEKRGLEVTLWEGYYKGPDYTEYPVTHIFYEKGADLTYIYGNAKGIGTITLVPVLEKAGTEQGVIFNYKTPAVQILRKTNGRVTGIIAGKPGKYIQYNTNKGVIIATGDYASNNEMKQRYSPFSLHADAQIYFPNKCNTGDGLIMAMQIGGAMQKSEPHAAVIHLEAGAASYGFLHVNANGERFKNEDVNTQSKSCTKELQPHGIAWTIYDRDWAEQVKQQVDSNLAGGLFYGQMWQQRGKGWNIEVEKTTLDHHIKDGKVLTANSIEELAQKMKVPIDRFKKTVMRYNELYEMQNDPDYGKRVQLLTSIVNPPFYAGKLASTLLTMVGGLHTDSSLLVLDKDDKPIEGLYVVGSAAGDFFANDYPTICPGIGHGRCLTFGRMAGIKAAGGDVDKLIPSLKV